MHSIKKKAQRSAWYGDDDDQHRTYNPFGRAHVRRRTRPQDTEEGSLYHSRTEADDEVSPVEARRQSSGSITDLRRRHSDELFTGPEKAGTVPSTGPVEETEDVPEKLIPSSTPHLVKPAHATSDAEVEPRKRCKLIPWKKQQQEDEDEEPKRKKSLPKLTLSSQIKVLFYAYINLLFVCVPAGFALNYTHQPAVAVFVVNFIAIIPSSAVLGFAVDQILMYVGDTIGGLISMSFGNTAQLISSILLLKTNQLDVLRASLLGAMLQNLLLMTGLSFFLGGLNRKEQYFNAIVAQTMGMFLLLAVLSLTILTVSRIWGHSSQAGIRDQSRGTAVVIMFSYALWLFFQLRTHVDMFREPSQKAPKKQSGKKEKGEALKSLATIGGTSAAVAGGTINRDTLVYDEEEEEEDIPQLTRISALLAIVVFTTILAFNTEFATDSIQGLMATHGISATFMGIVVLPILSNDPFSIDAAIKDKVDISIALTLERCMQTALMVVPLIVLIAWGMGIDEMTLDFDGFSVAALFASIVIVTYVVQEGKSNWLTGALLMKVFLIIGLASFYIDRNTSEQ